MSSLYVQYGCGWSAPREWRNFDASPTLRFERLPLLGRLYTRNTTRFPDNVAYGDIVRGLPIAPESCAGVYCSHVLEHLALEDFRKAIRNSLRLLKRDGTFRLVLPDLEHEARTYLGNPAPDASLRFMRDTCLGEERRPRGLGGALAFWLGNSRHLWMWDFRSLSAELESAGFRNVRRATFGDSADPMFRFVEDRSRWQDSLGMECFR
jgi:SAM-dependent methyltransferase